VGWALGTVNYSQWEAQNTYKVGDTLLFVYLASDHTVLEVNKADYDACNTATPIKTYTGGRSVVPISQAGNHWYICGTIGHCPTMAFGITVTAAAAAPPPVPTKSTPPKTAPAPSPTHSTPKTAPAPSPTHSTPKTAPAPSPSTVLSPSTVSPPPASPPASAGVSPSNATPPSSPTNSGSSALAAKPRGDAYMLLLGMLTLVFCSVLHHF